MFKLRTQKETFLRAMPKYSNLPNYCKFGIFRENFIFANSVKRHICHAQSSRKRHDLNVSINNRLNSLFREGFIFTKLRICDNKTTAKIFEFTVFTTKYAFFSIYAMYFGIIYCKQYGTRSDCSLRSNLVNVHRVCFRDKICLECI